MGRRVALVRRGGDDRRGGRLRARPARRGAGARGPRALLLAAAIASASLASGEARASLSDEARRISDHWKHAGLEVERPSPLFVEQGKLRRLPLEHLAQGEGCVTVAVLAPRGVDFQIRLVGVGSGDRQARPERAAAGLATFVRCGGERLELASAILEMRSNRASIELVVGKGEAQAPPPTEALPERVVVPPRPLHDPGRAPGHEALSARVARAEQRARLDGAQAVVRDEAQASDEGSGKMLVGFREGCHRIEILADLGPSGRAGDVDAELRDAQTNAVLARDRSDTPDGRLEICLGEGQGAAIVFGGAPPGAKIVVLDARWAFPRGINAAFGPKARAAAAAALLRRRAPSFDGPPVAEGLGVAGGTVVPVEIEPGFCYVAAVAAARGEVRHLSVATSIDGRASRDDGGPGRDGVAMAFCSRRSERAVVRVEARGAGVVWAMSVWRAGPSPVDEAQP